MEKLDCHVIFILNVKIHMNEVLLCNFDLQYRQFRESY